MIKCKEIFQTYEIHLTLRVIHEKFPPYLLLGLPPGLTVDLLLLGRKILIAQIVFLDEDLARTVGDGVGLAVRGEPH